MVLVISTLAFLKHNRARIGFECRDSPSSGQSLVRVHVFSISANKFLGHRDSGEMLQGPMHSL